MEPAAPESQNADPPRERTVAMAHAAMSSLLRHGIAPSPQHFAIWFDYHGGVNRPLIRLLDGYLHSETPITEALMREVHARFFDSRRESKSLVETSERLHALTVEFLGLVAEASGQTDSYGRSLGVFGHDLASGEGLVEALQRISAATEEMARRSAIMGERLEVSAQAVADLQQRLEAALLEARTDALTGLPNRRAMEQEAARCADAADADGSSFALAILDIDRFKALNDAWGHPVGDAVLRRVALTLRECGAEDVRSGRYGGEEFLVLLPRHDLAKAIWVAEQMRDAVAAQTYSVRATGRALGNVTVSAGIAVRQARESWEQALARADAALYRAKQAGRNRVAYDEDGFLGRSAEDA
jgi:diguanylate cyclase